MDFMTFVAKLTLDKSGYDEGLEESSKKASGFGSKIKSGIGAAAKAVAAGVAATGAAAVAIGKQSIEAYANYEQLIGGVETLYGSEYKTVEEYAKGVGLSLEEAAWSFEQYQNRQQTVLDNAANAYKTAGLSANEYMELTTSFAAALNSSLGEYAWQSANVADMAVTDMADNANKMGSSVEAIQNAYMGFSKQNYTMLDNLKLGYGGTKEEMERLLRDAEEMEGLIEGSYDLSNFADIVSAIHTVQENMGISGMSAETAAQMVAAGAMTEEEAFEAMGTTAKEASRTISGSLNATKSAWQNLLVGIADDSADVGSLVDQFVESVVATGDNILPRIQQILDGAANLIVSVAQQLIPVAVSAIIDNLPMLASSTLSLFETIANTIIDNTPQLLDAASGIMLTLVEGISAALPHLVESAGGIILTLATGLGEQLPTIIDAGLQAIVALASGISGSLPKLIPTIISVILQIRETLTSPSSMTSLLGAALDIILAVAQGLIQAIPDLVRAVPQIISNLVGSLVAMIPQIIVAGIQLLIALGMGLIEAIPELVIMLPEIILAIVGGLAQGVIQVVEIGKDLVMGLWEGIKSMWSWLVDSVTGLFSGLFDRVKKLFGISSPSKVFRDAIGKNIMLGMAEGIDDEADEAVDSLERASGKMLDVNFGQSYSLNAAGATSSGGDSARLLQMVLEEMRTMHSEMYTIILSALRTNSDEFDGSERDMIRLVKKYAFA